MPSRRPAARSASWPAPDRARRRRSRAASPGRSPRARFAPDEILAVTFTDKAAGVMRSRLAGLGAGGVAGADIPRGRARAAQPLRTRRRVGRILPTKALLLRQIANALPPPYTFRPGGDLATEIERAKARRVAPGRVPRVAGRARAADSGGPDAARLPRVRAAQEPSAARSTSRICSSSRSGCSTATTRALRGVPGPVPRVHRRRVPGRQPAPAGAARPAGSATVRRALRRRRRLPVDLRLHRRLAAVAARRPGSAFPRRRSSGWRTTTARRPQVLELANRLVPRLGGAEKVLRPTRSARAPRRSCAASPRPRRRTAGSSASSRASGARACRFEEMAVLCRTNARLADFEEVLHEAGIPFQGSSLLEREAARRLLRLLDARAVDGRRERASGRSPRRRAGSTSLPDKLGERELDPAGRPGTPRPRSRRSSTTAS